MYALTRPAPVDDALPGKLAAELAPVYAEGARLTPETRETVRLARLALGVSGDPQYRLMLGRALVAAEDCGALAELDRYAAEAHTSLVEALSDNDHHLATDLRARCAEDPSSAMEDLGELERFADQLDRTQPDKALLVLRHAIRVSQNQKPTLYLKLGDYSTDYGECAVAKDAYAAYIALAHLSGDELAAIRARETVCQPP